MKLSILTIVLDGEPYIEWHLPIFQQLQCDWHWYVVEGTSQNTADQSWCKPQTPRLSNDGTHEYLESIVGRRVTLTTSREWPNKTAMCNAALADITETCVLMQIDSDEVYKPETIDQIVALFETDNDLAIIRLPCRFFVGKDLICVGENCWSNRETEWQRAWRFIPGMKFVTHEPPQLDRVTGRTMDRFESSRHGLRFDHYAYVLEKQVAFKQEFYGYTGLLNQWRALQQHQVFPERLSRFFPFVDTTVRVDRVTT